MTFRTLHEMQKWGTDVLKGCGITDASTDALYLLEDVFDVDMAGLLLHRDEILTGDSDTKEKTGRYMQLINRRSEGCPVQYLTGYAEFMGYRFEVNTGVLIPRQDTETLAETALGLIGSESRVLDLCTGSGCIIISLCLKKNMDSGVGSDISDEALCVARRNRDRYGLSGVEMVRSDLFENIGGRFDLIVSNPPYIPTKETETLMREVRDYEPRIALDGSADGLAFYRKIAAGAADHLYPGGWLACETGWNQAGDVAKLYEQNGFEDIRTVKDLSGHDRVVCARIGG